MHISRAGHSAGAEHDIYTGRQSGQEYAHCFAEQSFQAITLNRALRNAFTYDKADAQSRHIVWTPREYEQPGCNASPLLPDLLKVAAFA
jgi:hypothetical protein